MNNTAARTVDDVLNIFALIRLGDHPRWRGDRILNSEHYLEVIARYDPGLAKKVVDHIADNPREVVIATGLPPRTVCLIEAALRRLLAPRLYLAGHNHRRGLAIMREFQRCDSVRFYTDLPYARRLVDRFNRMAHARATREARAVKFFPALA